MPKSTRIKPISLNNRVDFEVTVDRVTWIETELRRLAAERDAAVLKAQKTHAEAIQELEDEQELKTLLCEKFALANRAALLPDETKAKSVQTPHSVYGFRLGTHKLKLLSGWSWKKVLAKLLELHLTDHVRFKPSPNKDTLLVAAKANQPLIVHAEGEGADVEIPLSQVGIRVAQGESFFIEGKVDGAVAVKAGAA